MCGFQMGKYQVKINVPQNGSAGCLAVTILTGKNN